VFSCGVDLDLDLDFRGMAGEGCGGNLETGALGGR